MFATALCQFLPLENFGTQWPSHLLGDWLGLLATTALAQQLAGGDYATANFAIAGVFIARLLPSVILGPIAGDIVTGKQIGRAHV